MFNNTKKQKKFRMRRLTAIVLAVCIAAGTAAVARNPELITRKVYADALIFERNASIAAPDASAFKAKSKDDAYYKPTRNNPTGKSSGFLLDYEWQKGRLPVTMLLPVAEWSNIIDLSETLKTLPSHAQIKQTVLSFPQITNAVKTLENQFTAEEKALNDSGHIWFDRENNFIENSTVMDLSRPLAAGYMYGGSFMGTESRGTHTKYHDQNTSEGYHRYDDIYSIPWKTTKDVEKELYAYRAEATADKHHGYGDLSWIAVGWGARGDTKGDLANLDEMDRLSQRATGYVSPVFVVHGRPVMTSEKNTQPGPDMRPAGNFKNAAVSVTYMDRKSNSKAETVTKFASSRMNGAVIKGAKAGQTYSIPYDSADAGTDICMVIYDSNGNELFYGRLGKALAGGGSVNMKMPKLPDGERDYTAALFAEQNRGLIINKASEPAYFTISHGESINNVKNKAKNDVAAAEGRAKAANDNAAAANARATASAAEAAAAKSKVAELQKSLDGLNKQIADVSGKLAVSEKKAKEVSDELSKANNKLAETSGKLNETEDKLSKTSEKLTQTEGKLAETESELNVSKENLYDKREELDINKKRLKTTEAELHDLKEGLERDNEEHKKQLDDLNKEKTRIEQEKAEIEKALTGITEKIPAGDNASGAGATSGAAVEKTGIELLRQRVDDLINETRIQTEKAKKLNEDLDSINKTFDGIKAILSEAGYKGADVSEGVKQLVAERDAAKEAAKAATVKVEELMKSASEAAINTEKSMKAWAASYSAIDTEYKKEVKEKETMAASYSAIDAEYKKGVKEKEAWAASYAAINSKYEESLKNPNIQTNTVTKTVTVPSTEQAVALAEAEKLLRESGERETLYKNEIDKQKNEIDRQNDEIEKLKNEILKLKEEKDSTDKKSSEHQGTENRTSDRIPERQNTDERSIAEINKLAADINNLKATNDDITKKNALLVDQITGISAKNTELTGKNNELSEKNAALTETNTKLAEKNTELTAQNTALLSDNRTLTEKVNNLTSDNKVLSDKNNNLLSDNKALSDSNKNLREKFSALKEKYSTLLQKYKNLIAKYKALLKKNGSVKDNAAKAGTDTKAKGTKDRRTDTKTKYVTRYIDRPVETVRYISPDTKKSDKGNTDKGKSGKQNISTGNTGINKTAANPDIAGNDKGAVAEPAMHYDYDSMPDTGNYNPDDYIVNSAGSVAIGSEAAIGAETAAASDTSASSSAVTDAYDTEGSGYTSPDGEIIPVDYDTEQTGDTGIDTTEKSTKEAASRGVMTSTAIMILVILLITLAAVILLIRILKKVNGSHKGGSSKEGRTA